MSPLYSRVHLSPFHVFSSRCFFLSILSTCCFFFILLLPLHFCSRANRKQISSTHRVVIRSMNVCSGVAFAAAAAVVVVVFSFCSFHFLSHSMCVCASMIHILCNKTACPATYCTYGYQFNLTSGALSHFTQNNSGKKMISFMNNLGE